MVDIEVIPISDVNGSDEPSTKALSTSNSSGAHRSAADDSQMLSISREILGSSQSSSSSSLSSSSSCSSSSSDADESSSSSSSSSSCSSSSSLSCEILVDESLTCELLKLNPVQNIDLASPAKSETIAEEGTLTKRQDSETCQLSDHSVPKQENEAARSMSQDRYPDDTPKLRKGRKWPPGALLSTDLCGETRLSIAKPCRSPMNPKTTKCNNAAVTPSPTIASALQMKQQNKRDGDTHYLSSQSQQESPQQDQGTLIYSNDQSASRTQRSTTWEHQQHLGDFEPTPYTKSPHFNTRRNHSTWEQQRRKQSKLQLRAFERPQDNQLKQFNVELSLDILSNASPNMVMKGQEEYNNLQGDPHSHSMRLEHPLSTSMSTNLSRGGVHLRKRFRYLTSANQTAALPTASVSSLTQGGVRRRYASASVQRLGGGMFDTPGADWNDNNMEPSCSAVVERLTSPHGHSEHLTDMATPRHSYNGDHSYPEDEHLEFSEKSSFHSFLCSKKPSMEFNNDVNHPFGRDVTLNNTQAIMYQTNETRPNSTYSPSEYRNGHIYQDLETHQFDDGTCNDFPVENQAHLCNMPSASPGKNQGTHSSSQSINNAFKIGYKEEFCANLHESSCMGNGSAAAVGQRVELPDSFSPRPLAEIGTDADACGISDLNSTDESLFDDAFL